MIDPGNLVRPAWPRGSAKVFLTEVEGGTQLTYSAKVHISGKLAQVGSRLGAKLPAEYLRALLAALVLGVAIKLAFGLFTPPSDIYSVSTIND